MRKRPTISTVARQAGVANSTVSRYLNGGDSVSVPVRDRLSRIIAEIGYAPSWTARNLSIGRRGCIGVAVDSTQDPWFVHLLTGIEEELAARDSSLMLASTELNGRYDPSRVFQWIHDRRLDGLIVVKAQRRESPLLVAALEAHLPTVAIVPDEIVPGVRIVRCDNRRAGVAAADHLASLGHRRIAFVGGPRHSMDSQDRLWGLREGLGQRGIRLKRARVFSCDRWDFDAGSELARAFFERVLDVTAVVLANDALALGFMRIARQRGICLPQALSIVGFDGLAQSALFYPALTSVAQPMHEMGRVACQRVFVPIGDPASIEQTEFEMELVVRESTAPPIRPTRASPIVRRFSAGHTGPRPREVGSGPHDVVLTRESSPSELGRR